MTEATPDPRRWWTLAVLCLSLIIVTTGNTSLNVVIPRLSRQLGASSSQLQWAVAGYSLVFAGVLFTAGALGDRFGRKGALQLGLVVFVIGSALASASTAMWQIIACRALMGAAAAFIMPSTLSILVNVFPAHERAKAIAIWAGIAGSAGSIGPLLSGWLLGHFWYGSVFLVNVPLVAIALGTGAFLVPRSKNPHEADLDVVGAALSVVGLSSLVYGLIQAPEHGWTSTESLAAFLVGIAVLVLFVVWERRVAHPMLDMAYFSNRAFSTATGGMILTFLAMYGIMFLIGQDFQLILGYSPLSAALRFLPMAPIMMIVAPNTPRIVARIGANRTVATGMALVALGFLLFATLQVDSGYLHVLGPMLVLISGIALTTSPMTAAIMSAVPPTRAGAGSAMNDATREMGAALGVAVLGSVAASRYASGIAPVLANLAPAEQAAARTSLGAALQSATKLPAAVAGPLVHAAEHAFVDGIHIACIAGASLTAIAAIAVWRFLPGHIAQHGALHGPLGSAEDVAEMVLGGALPVFSDAPDDGPGDAPDERPGVESDFGSGAG